MGVEKVSGLRSPAAAAQHLRAWNAPRRHRRIVQRTRTFRKVSVTGSRVGWETGRRAAKRTGFASFISLRYLNIYPVIHIYPFGAAAFWVKNIMFLGKYTRIQCLSSATHKDLSKTVRAYDNTHKLLCVSHQKSLELLNRAPRQL